MFVKKKWFQNRPPHLVEVPASIQYQSNRHEPSLPEQPSEFAHLLLRAVYHAVKLKVFLFSKDVVYNFFSRRFAFCMKSEFDVM